MEAQRRVRKDVNGIAADSDRVAVQRLRREAQAKAEAKVREEAAVELARKAKKERERKEIMEERSRQFGRLSHESNEAPSPAPTPSGRASRG